MKIWLRLVYADGDVAATLLRPWRWSCAFVALLYPFYIESEISIRFYYTEQQKKRIFGIVYKGPRTVLMKDCP